MESENKIFILLPYIRTTEGVKIGKFVFKAYNDIQKESQEDKEELARIISFFREKETRLIDAFNYLIFEASQEELTKKLEELRRSIEIFRYLTVDPEGKGLAFEHTTAYIIIPDTKNPWVFKEGEKHYIYQVTENFAAGSAHVSYPNASQKPPFYKDIYGNNPPYVDDELFEKLLSKLSDTDLRAITWHNKTYSVNAQDAKENLLRLSVAFESFFALDEEPGREVALHEIREKLKEKFEEEQLNEISKVVKQSITTLITRRLGENVENITGSVLIKQWFKTHFYSVGSGIRHGDDVSELPKPIISRSKDGKSLWYGERASHGFISNVYFGKKLFKFLLEDRYFPYKAELRAYKIRSLEQLLVSDEERLKSLEKTIEGKKPGEITSQEIMVSFSLGNSYFGNKLRVFNLLKRLLIELKHTSSLWEKISEKGELLINASLTEEDINNREKFTPYANALIDIDSEIYSAKENDSYSEENMKEFYIKQFIGFSVHCLL